jgi:hypothetical protein
MSAGAAVTIAARLLASVADTHGRESVILSLEGLELTGGHREDGEGYARLVLTIEGAPLTVELDATKAAELSIALASAVRHLDSPAPPRSDG